MRVRVCACELVRGTFPGTKAGLRATGTRADCALIVADEPAVSAGVFTQNRVAAAPVMYCRDVMKKNEKARAVLVNAGGGAPSIHAALTRLLYPFFNSQKSPSKRLFEAVHHHS